MRIDLNQARRVLLLGQPIAIPTDTVYGLAALVHDELCVLQIYKLKQRPDSRPLIILGADIGQLRPFITNVPHDFEEIAEKNWPGALTVIVDANLDRVPPLVRAGGDTIGLRIPDDPLTRSLLRSVGPIVATSVNRSGAPPAHSPEEIERFLGPSFPILESESSLSGTPSTIIAYQNGSWHCLREGAVPFKPNL